MEQNFGEKEKQYLINNYKNKSIKEMANTLNLSYQKVYGFLYHHRYINKPRKAWSETEIEYLKNNYNHKSILDIAEYLNRTKSNVEREINLLNINKDKSNKNWTEEEIQYLKENISYKEYDEIANALNRSIKAIYTKVWELKLIEDEYKGYKFLKKDQIEFIKNHYNEYTDMTLASMFHVSESAIIGVRKKYKLKKTRTIQKVTYIEKRIMDLLDKYHIDYLHNKKIGNYEPDFLLSNKKVIIEVQGDYFHCNPYIYKNGPKNDIQVKQIIADYTKKCFYLSHGYTLYEIWKYDIINNFSQVEELIKELSAAYG